MSLNTSMLVNGSESINEKLIVNSNYEPSNPFQHPPPPPYSPSETSTSSSRSGSQPSRPSSKSKPSQLPSAPQVDTSKVTEYLVRGIVQDLGVMLIHAGKEAGRAEAARDHANKSIRKMEKIIQAKDEEIRELKRQLDQNKQEIEDLRLKIKKSEENSKKKKNSNCLLS